MKRISSKNADEALLKKRSNDRKSYAAKRNFEKTYDKYNFFEPYSHNTYVPTAEQRDSWTRTIYARFSQAHGLIDTESRQ